MEDTELPLKKSSHTETWKGQAMNRRMKLSKDWLIIFNIRGKDLVCVSVCLCICVTFYLFSSMLYRSIPYKCYSTILFIKIEVIFLDFFFFRSHTIFIFFNTGWNSLCYLAHFSSLSLTFRTKNLAPFST